MYLKILHLLADADTGDADGICSQILNCCCFAHEVVELIAASTDNATSEVPATVVVGFCCC